MRGSLTSDDWGPGDGTSWTWLTFPFRKDRKETSSWWMTRGSSGSGSSHHNRTCPDTGSTRTWVGPGTVDTVPNPSHPVRVGRRLVFPERSGRQMYVLRLTHWESRSERDPNLTVPVRIRYPTCVVQPRMDQSRGRTWGISRVTRGVHQGGDQCIPPRFFTSCVGKIPGSWGKEV